GWSRTRSQSRSGPAGPGPPLPASRPPNEILIAPPKTFYQPPALLAHPQQLLDRRLALDHLPQPVLLEVLHPLLDGLLADGVEVGILADQLPDAVRDEQQLEDARAPVIARVVAVGAEPPVALLGRRLRHS